MSEQTVADRSPPEASPDSFKRGKTPRRHRSSGNRSGIASHDLERAARLVNERKDQLHSETSTRFQIKALCQAHAVTATEILNCVGESCLSETGIFRPNSVDTRASLHW